MNRKTERILKRITGTFLAAVILTTTLVQHVSADEIVKISYISEISVGSKAELEANGFTVSSTPINGLTTLSTGQQITTSGIDQSFSDSDCIGYKTTLDRSKAITDVKIMHMNGGYQRINMDSFVNENADGVSQTIDIVFAALDEFRENFNNGSRPAKIAYQTLNYLDVPQLDGSEDIPLGDYLLDTARTRDDIRDIVLLSNTVIVSLIKNQLILGVADDMSPNTEGLTLTDEERAEPADLYDLKAFSWLDRLVNNGPFEENITDPEELESTYLELDKSYYQQTLSVINSVRNFAAKYKEALENQGTVEAAAENTADEEENSGEKSAADILEGREEGNQSAGDLNVLSLYNYLDSRNGDGTPVYFYGTKADGTARSFAEFLIEVGEMDEDTEDQEARRLLYPLFVEQGGEAPMTKGQWSILRISDLGTFMMSTVLEKVDYAAMAKKTNKKGDELLAANGTERVSVWYGVDYEFYKNGGELYMTSEKIRLDAANKQYDILTKKTYEQNGLTDSQIMKNALVSLGIAAATVFTVLQILKIVRSAMIAEEVAIASMELGMTTSAAVESVLGATCAGMTTAISVCAMVIAVLIVCAIIIFIVYKLLQKKEKEEESAEKPVVMLPIPEYLLDTHQTAEDKYIDLQYRAVCAPGTTTPQNLNRIYTNTPWVVLYTTTDPDAGEPLSVNNEDGTARIPFVFTSNATDEVGKYCPLTNFEESVAGNLKGESNKGGSPVFLWLHRVNDAANPAAFSGGKYVLEVKLSSATNATEAKDAIRNQKGYTLIDYDLTSDCAGLYTYLGYSTTDNAEFALRDLRFAYSPGVDNQNGKVIFGDSTYSVFGYAGNLLLFGTRSELAGSPILADGFKVVSTLGAVDPGYEPVNLFSGGPALDVNSCGNWTAGATPGEGNEGAGQWNSHSYIYFLPETTYTGGTEYLSGLCFFGAMTGSGEKGSIDSSFVPEGWKRLSDTDVSGNQKGSMYLYYSTTYNPKRAITDVKFYQAEPNAMQAAYNLSYGSEGYYVAVDVWQQGTQLSSTEKGLYYEPSVRLLRSTHGYRSSIFCEGGGFFESVTADNMRKVEDGSNATMEYYNVTYADGSTRIVGTNIRCTALYVVGPVSSKEPLKAGELIARNTATYDENTETPIRNFTDAYAKTGANLGYQGAGGSIEWNVEYTVTAFDLKEGRWVQGREKYSNKLENSSNYSSLYLFIERADPYKTRGTLVKSIAVSYAGNDRYSKGTRSSYGAKYTYTVDGKEQTGYDTPYDTVCYDLFSNGPGQLIRMNLASGEGGSRESTAGGVLPTSDWDAWAMGARSSSFDADNINVRNTFTKVSLDDVTESITKPCIDSDYSTEVAYLWVTYTSKKAEAISDLMIYETEDTSSATKTKKFKVTKEAQVTQGAQRCGEGWKADPSSSTWYYLYAVYSNGHQVKELLVDDEPLTYQYKTVLNTDFKCSGSNRYFLKTKNVKSALLATKDYLSNIATGEGTTKRDAQIDLLNAGCSEYVPFNVSSTDGRYEYLGYNTTTKKVNAYSGFLLYNTEYDKNAVSLDYGYIHFDVLSNDLNRNAAGYALYLFGTKNALFSQNYQDGGTRYAMQVCLYPGTDLNDYASGEKKVESIADSTLREYTRFLVGDDDGTPVCWTQVNGVRKQVVSLNLGREYLDSSTDMYLYVHYSDNYSGTTNVTDTGSIFAYRAMPLLLVSGCVLILAALIVLIIRKKRMRSA